jgi:L-alanine-DL-glutamate epimerase-like enolase superfamily enzyme
LRKQALINKNGFRYQKWFIGYGPGSGPESMEKNVELVRILRETVGDDTEFMFDAHSGWDQHYYHFESNPMVPAKAHIALPTEPGFGIVLDQAKIESQTPLALD